MNALPKMQGMPPELSIVIYCYNDALTVEAQIRSWITVLDEEKISFEVIACNAGSIDGTGRILDNLRRERTEIRVLHQLKIGINQSIRRGYESARGRFVLQLVGTGQNDPEDFRPIWGARNQHDLILGDRKHRLDGWLRPLFSLGLRKSIKALYGVVIPDSNVPFRLFRRSVVLPLLQELPKNMESTNICMSLILKKGHPERVTTVAIPYRLPPKGKVRGSFPKLLGQGLHVFAELLRLRLSFSRYLRLSSLSPIQA